MKRILSQRIGALILAMAISMSLVSPCVSYAVEKGCPLQEHQHTSECYKLPNKRKLNCGVIAHSHGPECYDGEGTLVCGYSDKIIHTHDKNCYDEDGNLVCDLPEYETHTHTKDCYEESRVLVCQEVVLPPPTNIRNPATRTRKNVSVGRKTMKHTSIQTNVSKWKKFLSVQRMK